MFSKILIKLIDEAVVPAIYLITVRVVSLVFISHSLDIPINLGPSGFMYSSQTDYMTVNSYSLLFMVLALCLGLLHVIVKALVFHDTHISPPLAAKLHSLKAQHLIQNTYHLYSQGIVWLAYLYFLTIGAGVMCIFGMLHPWIAYISLGLAVLVTYIFIYDAEKELLAAAGKKK